MVFLLDVVNAGQPGLQAKQSSRNSERSDESLDKREMNTEQNRVNCPDSSQPQQHSKGKGILE